MSSNTASTPASISSIMLASQGMVVEMNLSPGIPLPREADSASPTKPLLTSVTVGFFLSSITIESYTRYLVQEPQSPKAAMTASTPLSQSSNCSLTLVSVTVSFGVRLPNSVNSTVGNFSPNFF